MTKAEIRLKYRHLRSLLTEDDIRLNSIAIADNFANLDIWDKTYFHVFLPITNFKEVDTSYIIDLLRENKKEIIASKSNFDTMEMTHFLTDDKTTFLVNKYNITEPENAESINIEKIEVVLVPLLAFDKNGHRVGYGKGFYDRFMLQCNSECIFIGLSFFDAEELIENIAPNDCKLNYCMLPAEIISF